MPTLRFLHDRSRRNGGTLTRYRYNVRKLAVSGRSALEPHSREADLKPAHPQLTAYGPVSELASAEIRGVIDRTDHSQSERSQLVNVRHRLFDCGRGSLVGCRGGIDFRSPV